MRILLTGGAGFIGSHVADLLLQDGHEVAVVDDLSRGQRERVPEGATFYQVDVLSGCEDVFRGFQPDALCHQAAQISVRRSVAEPVQDLTVNTVGTLRLLENCVRHGTSRFVLASTGGAIYGEQYEFPATEDHTQYPVSPYGISKLAAERYLNFYRTEYGLSGVALRYANVYGPRQDTYGEAGVVAIFAERMSGGEKCFVNGTGEQTRDYVYVEDVARANLLALGPKAVSGAYNIGTGIETSVNDLYASMAEVSGTQTAPEYRPAQPGEQFRSSVDSTRASLSLGWRPEVELFDGITKTLEHFGVPRQP